MAEIQSGAPERHDKEETAEAPADPEPGPQRTTPIQAEATTSSANGHDPSKSGESIVNRLLTVVGLRSVTSLREDIADALEADEQTAGSDQFSPEERTILRNILGLRERRVDDAMVPRVDIIAVDSTISLGELLRVFQSAGHSRIPVFRETLDEPVGMVHIKDVMNAITGSAALSKAQLAARKTPLPGGLDLKQFKLNRPLDATKLIRTVLFVPPSMPALDLLAQMQATRVHMAIVIDEYGGTDGLVTIEDLMEEIVGEIEDEHDDDEDTMIRTATDGSLIVDARAPIEDLSAETGIDFSAHEGSDEIDTLGGLVFMLTGRIPVRGELVPYAGQVELEVVEADPRRIKRLKIHRRVPNGGAT